MIGAARLKCGEPAAEAGELIWRQVGDSFGDFFDFHAAKYSTGARAWLSHGIAGFGLRLRRLTAPLGWTGRGPPILSVRRANRQIAKSLISLIGVAAFEPATPSSRTRCATRPRYAQTCVSQRTGGRSRRNGARRNARRSVTPCAIAPARPRRSTARTARTRATRLNSIDARTRLRSVAGGLAWPRRGSALTRPRASRCKRSMSMPSGLSLTVPREPCTFHS